MGRRIDDHSFWAGKGDKDSVLPMGSKMKSINEVEGAGHINKYEDTEEAVAGLQKRGATQIHRHGQPSDERN